ncbi:hypothetical protein IG631_12966 [Alternaria alternata]|nr:hypothetical protein IG631_12966 [Alternaria alternata]
MALASICVNTWALARRRDRTTACGAVQACCYSLYMPKDWARSLASSVRILVSQGCVQWSPIRPHHLVCGDSRLHNTEWTGLGCSDLGPLCRDEYERDGLKIVREVHTITYWWRLTGVARGRIGGGGGRVIP